MNFFYLDVDGVLTDGTFLYDCNGKSHKVFGADDSDALTILRKYIPIEFVSADQRGIEISRARIERDMGFKLTLVPSVSRLKWLTQRHDLKDVIYMGDGFVDAPVLKQVSIGIAPHNASPLAKQAADHVTKASGGSGAVAEACFYVARILGLTVSEFEGTQ
jgi:3-deoxy-D-manno-octulosonate 8-phosphate phosphatase (KDO 8-P phosphatase)